MNLPRRLAILMILATCCSAGAQEIYYNELPADLIESRLNRAADDNAARERVLTDIFTEVDCKGAQLMEQPVKTSKLPNVICELDGTSDQVIIVGAHFDKVSLGHGLIDNRTGASLLPSLYQSLQGNSRNFTFRFIGFTDEERGLYGSNFYVRQLTKEDKRKIRAMINIDSLGLDSTRVWVTRSDKRLFNLLLQVVSSLQMKIWSGNIDGVGDSDSHAFANSGIPVMDFHSLTSKTLPVLHSNKDSLEALNSKEYYDSYRLIAAYLAFLDIALDKSDAGKN